MLCPKICLARSIVRETDEMKIPQRFGAKIRIHKIYISPRSGRLNTVRTRAVARWIDHATLSLDPVATASGSDCRPLTRTHCVLEIDPSAKSAGPLSHGPLARTDTTFDFLGKAAHLCAGLIGPLCAGSFHHIAS
jgi:hypothetical protein